MDILTNKDFILSLSQKNKQKSEEKRLKIFWQNAMYNASLQDGIFKVFWEKLPNIDPVLYDFHKNFGFHLKALRLVGIGLEVIPDEIGTNLRQLEILSLANNQIAVVPDSLVQLTNLRDLNLIYNKIEKLPDRIGFMCALEKLGITNNRILSLPITFGALNLIQKIDLEQNKLKVLPENLDNLTSCASLNLSFNELTRLPRCIGRMPSLTLLSASGNRISYIPQELCTSKTLHTIRLSRNLIRFIPERIGELTQLMELTLDYNEINKFPLSFWKLINLKILKLEGSTGLLDPPPEVMMQGGAKVVEYCRIAYMNDKKARMRHIILATQDVLDQIHTRQLGDPAYFEGDVQLTEGDPDRWCALQPEHFWNDLLPMLQKIWRTDTSQGLADLNRVYSYTFTKQEMMWAFSNYNDALGPVITQRKAKFRVCGCVDKKGVRKPCVPPEPGYMCFRECLMLKKSLVRQADKQERLWTLYKSNGIQDAMKRTEVDAIEYLNSTEGQLWLERVAYEQTEELVTETGATKAVEKRLKQVENQKKAVIKKFDIKKAKIQKVRDKKVLLMQTELGKLKEDRRVCNEGYVRNAIEHRIRQITLEMANLEETKKLNQLQDLCEAECAVLDANLYEDDSVNTSELDSSEFSSDDNTPEAQKWRIRMRKKRQRELDKERRDGLRDRMRLPNKTDKRKSQERDETALTIAKESATAIATGTKRVFEATVMRPLVRPTARAVGDRYHKYKKKIRRRMRNAVEVAKIRVRKVVQQLGGRFDEVQKELKYEIYRQYLDHHIQIAKEKAEHEFAVLDTVRTNVQGVSREKAFKAWKWWVLTKRRRLRQDLRRSWKIAIKKFDSAMSSVNSAQGQLDFWVKQYDVYDDTPFWVHRVTHAVTKDEPGLQHFLPPNFEIPPPPPDLPPDLSLYSDSSSDGEGEEWLAKHEQKRRRREEEKRLARLALHGREDSETESDEDSEPDSEIPENSLNPIPQPTSSRSHKSRSSDGSYGDFGENLDTPGKGKSLKAGKITITVPSNEPSLRTENSNEQKESGSAPADSVSKLSSQSLSTGTGDSLKTSGSQDSAVDLKDGTNVFDDGLGRMEMQQRQQWEAEQRRRGNNIKPLAPTPGVTAQMDSRSLKILAPHQRQTRPLSPTAKLLQTVERAREYMRTSVMYQQHHAKQFQSPLQRDLIRQGAAEDRIIPYSQKAEIPVEQSLLTFDELQEHLEVGHRKLSTAEQQSLVVQDFVPCLDPRELQESMIQIKEKAGDEFEIAYKAIRKRRNQLNPVRHHTYMHQLNRRIRSLEQHMEEMRAIGTPDVQVTLADGISINEKELQTLVKPTEKDLLKIAGGNIDMIHTGKQGMDLRTVLAQRALHVKKKLKQKAIDYRLVKNKDTVYKRELKPLFMKEYDGSSSESSEDEEEAKRVRREERRKRRVQKDKEMRIQQKLMEKGESKKLTALGKK